MKGGYTLRLIKLSANNPGFRTVKFNKIGISLIVGKRENPEIKNLKKTYNGVGKSLMIQLIHFCLASNSLKEFKKKIPDWEFSLEFEIKDESFVSTRNTSEQDTIVLNGKKFKLKARGFLARVLQHETDHLNGSTIKDRRA